MRGKTSLINLRENFIRHLKKTTKTQGRGKKIMNIYGHRVKESYRTEILSFF